MAVPMALALLFAAAAYMSPLAAGGGGQDHGNQWDHFWIDENLFATCVMHGEDELPSEHRCDDDEGDHATGDVQCVTQAHESPDFGPDQIEDHDEIHTQTTGCSGGT